MSVVLSTSTVPSPLSNSLLLRIWHAHVLALVRDARVPSSRLLLEPRHVTTWLSVLLSLSSNVSLCFRPLSRYRAPTESFHSHRILLSSHSALPTNQPLALSSPNKSFPP